MDRRVLQGQHSGNYPIGPPQNPVRERPTRGAAERGHPVRYKGERVGVSVHAGQHDILGKNSMIDSNNIICSPCLLHLTHKLIHPLGFHSTFRPFLAWPASLHVHLFVIRNLAVVTRDGYQLGTHLIVHPLNLIAELRCVFQLLIAILQLRFDVNANRPCSRRGF